MPSWLTDIRGKVPARTALLLGLLPVVVLLGGWCLATSGATVEDRWVNPQVLPSPGEVLDLVVKQDEQGQTWLTRRWAETGGNHVVHHAWASVRRVALAFLLAVGLTLPLGVAAGAFGAIRATLSPLMTASGYIPIAALVPLTMSWFGLGEAQKVLFLALAFAIVLLPQVLKAIEGVDEVFVRTARTLGADRRQLIFRVLVPIAAPDIWHALRLSFGVGWTYIMLTEAVVQTDGLGYLITIAQRRGPREAIYLTILLITLIAFLADLGMARLGAWLFPWRQEDRR